MKEKRKFELFVANKVKVDRSFGVCPPALYRQERDWTCAFACIRTIVSSFRPHWYSEDELISRYALTPKPYFSADIKKSGIIDSFDAVFGCDYDKVSFNQIVGYLTEGYSIMLESMVNCSHWMVMLGLYVLGDKNDPESMRITFFDPYYNDVKIMLLDEFINMWIDGDNERNGIEYDFIAIKEK